MWVFSEFSFNSIMAKVQGYISNFNDDENICYSLTRTQISEMETEYSGWIGYALICTGETCSYEEEECKLANPNENIHPSDMTRFSCTYDSKHNWITITSPYRFEYNSTIHPENHAFELNFADKKDLEEIDANSYPYIRFPRTKDGVSISRICLTLFSDILQHDSPMIYFPKTTSKERLTS